MIEQTDIERVNTQLRIEDVVAASGLTVVNRGNKYTTAEHDSLILYPATNSWAQFSQSGQQGKTLGGRVLDWFTKWERLPFIEAYAKAEAMRGSVPAATVSQARPTHRRQTEQPATDYRQQAVAAAKRLGTPAGEVVAAYLDSRGIDYVTARAWGLGAHDWYGKPAVALPHSDGQRVTVKLRLLPPTKDGDKCRWLGDPHSIFGEHMLPHCAEDKRTLIATEGELNAVSVWAAVGRYTPPRQPGQPAGGYLPVDAVSFGNKTVPAHLQDRLIALAKPYRHVIVWTDESEDTQRILAAIPGAIGIKTQYDNGVKLDANEMLQRGLLAGFVAALLDKYATDDKERQALAWAIWDEANTWGGISEYEADVLRSLAGRLGLDIRLRENAGRWYTSK